VARGRRRRLLLQVAVQIGRHAQFGMPEQHRHFNQLDACSDQQSGGRMPQVVKAAPRQARPFEERVQYAQHVARMQWRTHTHARPSAGKRGEHDAITCREEVPLRDHNRSPR
jgi:Fe-S-cluster-containing dehydrogenase component